VVPSTRRRISARGPFPRARSSPAKTSSAANAIPLGTVRQRGGKLVHAWALEGDLDPAAAHSNTFTLEWPPGSGRLEAFPEIDRVAWFDLGEARARLKDAQVAFLDRLVEALGP
jgi:predicted NUDIX family NTP pyrophosphohydrolase